MSAGALAGIRVLDFSRVLAGPYATMTMADLGADVIKVEGPAGDDTRQWRPPADDRGMSTYFASVNRNKRAVVLDLKNPSDRDRAAGLARTADVVVQNLRPGAMAGFGLDEETLRRANPGLVYVSISGFGEAGGAGLPGYDLLAQALGGLMSITGEQDGAPTKAGVAVVDVLTGMNAVIGTLAALRARDLDGLGQHVRVNLMSSVLAALVNQASATVVTGSAPTRMGNDHPSIAPYAVYRAADRELVLAVGNDRQFAALAEVLGRPEWIADPRFVSNPERVRHRADLRRELEAALAGDTAESWAGTLVGRGVPAGAVNSLTEALELAERLGLDPVVQPADGVGPATVRSPLFLSRHAPVYESSPPELGASDGDIRWLH